MTIKKRLTLAQRLKGATDAELADMAPLRASKIKTLKECQNRSLALLRAAKAHGVTWGNGKRCSPHHRCGNLACPICRYRAQLALIITWSDRSRPSKTWRVKQ